MSVQAGIWNFDGRPVDRKLLGDFSESLMQQGPDGESCHMDGSVALLYRPFHTTAESRLEKQPYFSRRGFILTWDGRLDNRVDLVADLRSELKADPADVAIVAAAFDRWETDCFRRFVGDWAMSIWKPEQRELLFAADYMAIRHIFYYSKKDRISWSTDLGSLVLISGDKFHIDDEYIAGYFAHDPDAHLTPYHEIREVPPGQFVHVRNGKVSVERFWRFSPKSRIRYKADAEYEEHFRHVFRQSVRRRLQSDSPVLAELSGGLDSSSIVCMADDILAKEGAQAPRLDTVSYYDPKEPRADDWPHFTRVEKMRGRTGFHIDSGRYYPSFALGFPTFVTLPGSLGSEYEFDAERFELIKTRGYKVMLSGVGGDEFLGGVPNPRHLIADLIVQLRPVELAKQLGAWSLAKRRPWIQLLWDSVCLLLPGELRTLVDNEAIIGDWIASAFARQHSLARLNLGPLESFGFRLPSSKEYARTLITMARQMAHTQPPPRTVLENSYPCLDQDLVEFIISVPASQLLRPGERRSLMRRALVGILPPEILSRRTKATSSRWYMVALEKGWSDLTDILTDPLCSRLGYIKQNAFQQALLAVKNGKLRLDMVRLLKAICLELWLRDAAKRGVVVLPAQAPLMAGVDSAQSPAQQLFTKDPRREELTRKDFIHSDYSR